jgi:LAO/AO transport system kinase
VSREIDVDAYAAGVLGGRRAVLARAVTLVESTHTTDRAAARRLLRLLAPYTGRAHRIGISGVPGAGKSTFIDALGSLLTARGHRVAVLAVDPSSSRTGGSVLGDRTRMTRLATDPAAFVRPSPTAGALGGLARATGDVIAVVEAAGFDVVLVETVGVGQSEADVADHVDSFLLLAVAGTGDQLQAIKMGVLERVDLIAVNKADGVNEPAARAAARDLSGALRLVRGAAGRAAPDVLTCSARDGTGVEEVWHRLCRHHAGRVAADALPAHRARQRVSHLRTAVQARLLDRLTGDPAVAALVSTVERAVGAAEITADEGADQIVTALYGGGPDPDRLPGS